MWLIPMESPPVLWDTSMCEDATKGSVVRDILSKACVAPLPSTQSEVCDPFLFLFFHNNQGCFDLGAFCRTCQTFVMCVAALSVRYVTVFIQSGCFILWCYSSSM